MAEQLSYVNHARPFKNPHYTKNVNRRTKNLKAVLTQERERERLEREKRRQEREEKMEVDGESAEVPLEEDLPTCECPVCVCQWVLILRRFFYRITPLCSTAAQIL